MKNLIYMAILCFYIMSCKTGNETVVKNTAENETFVSSIKPFEDLEIKAQIFKINASEKSVIELKNGSKIEIPAEAFVDKEGNQIKGDVNLEWQEFHSLTDIILSGIPMKYDSAGVENDFVSGGMFTINASQKGEKLELAPNKKAKVDLASVEDTPCFNFYKLDEKSGDWDYKLTASGTKNPEIVEKPEVKNNDLENFKLIDAEVNTVDFPELQNEKIVAWKTKDNISKFNFSELSTSTKLSKSEKPNEYNLEVKSKTKISIIAVEPYTLEEAKRNSQKVDKLMEKDFSEELKFQNDLKTGKIIRSVELESLGTYNWDAILHIDNHVTVFADLNFPKNIKNQAVTLFFICPELNATIKVNTAEENPTIKFDPKKKFTLIGILSDNSIVEINDNELDNLKRTKTNTKVKLDFTKTGRKIKSGLDLQNIITENV